ncbi:MAG: right-handed parallel beta-helix repeat-containing protein, partial [Nanobdellota archaeon]
YDISQCEDNNSCTTNDCFSGRCMFNPVSNCGASVNITVNNQTNQTNTTNQNNNTVQCTNSTQCNDYKSCTRDLCSLNKCVFTNITSCISGDGCCPTGRGCTYSNDGDCLPVCGNNIKEGNEKCDGTALGGATCAGVLGTGYTGVLKCSNCLFNSSLCVAPCTQTCSSLGYACGNRTICGKTVNCGSCSTGFNCNDNGACMKISNTTPNPNITNPTGNIYYVATNGNDNNPGTIEQPWGTWQKAFDVAQAGDTIYIRGGRYLPSIGDGYGVYIYNKKGSVDKPIKIYAYPGETPILDCYTNSHSIYHGIYLEECDFWELNGLTVINAMQPIDGSNTGVGFNLKNCDRILLKSCTSRNNQGPGFQFYYGVNSNITAVDCDAYNNFDPYTGSPNGEGGNADGFVTYANDALSITSFLRCRSWNNSDDGFDTYGTDGLVTFDSCWSFRNGYGLAGNGMGFKLGITYENTPSDYRRILIDCISADNLAVGFDGNSVNAKCQLYNNFAYSNTNGWSFGGGNPNLGHLFINNLDYGNNNLGGFGSLNIHNHNSWDTSGIFVTDSDFVSLDVKQLYSPREPDGSLPKNVTFGHLVQGSDLINKGVNVGLPYSGNYPDIGAFEYTGTTTPSTPYTRTFYVSSSSGDDGNTGTSPSSPWKTIGKVNSYNFLPGDGILFKRGDTFYGSLNVGSSGNSGNPITYGAYGSGEKPVISGFTTVTGWTNEGNGIYSKVFSVESSSRIVSFDGINTGMGRYPDSSWMTPDSYSGTTSLTDSDLNSATTNWRGAEAVIKTNLYVTNHLSITGHSGSTLTYSMGTTFVPLEGYGYFIQNDLKTLTKYKEWYYNPSTSKFYIYFGNENPNNHIVKVASLDNGVNILSKSYITFDGIAFEGFNNNGFYLDNSPHITIKNCDIKFINNNAIDGVGSGAGTSSYLLFDNNTVSDINNNGFYLLGQFTHATISNNVINNVGLIFGTGYPKDLASHAAIRVGPHGGDNQNSVIEYNTLTNIGYLGIAFMGTNIIVRNNFINGFCLTENDGGALYTYQEDSQVRSASIVNNIALNGLGNIEGTTNPSYDRAAPGIYTDGYTNGITISGNTVANCTYSSGWLNNGNTGGTFTDNTLYANRYQIYTTSSSGIANMNIERNILVSRDPSPSYAWFFYSSGGNFLPSTIVDYNYYARPIDNTNFMLLWMPPSPAYYYTLEQWKSATGKDTHSATISTPVASKNDIRFEYNPTKVDKIIPLDRAYVDVTGKLYSGSVTLKPYTSIILIKY